MTHTELKVAHSPRTAATRAPRRVSRTPLWSWKLTLGVVAVVALLILSLMVGEYSILSQEDGSHIFLTTRVPRTIALVLAGAAMAMCGVIMQLLTQNRFVEPTTTGTTEWAGLGLVCSLILVPGAPVYVRMVVAVVFSFVGTMVFFAFLRRVTLRSSLIVPVIGIMLGAVISAISSYVALATDTLQQLGMWFMGSFTAVYSGQYEVLWVVLLVVIAVFFYADKLTVAGLGEEIATNVGLNYKRVLLVGTGLVAVATGVVTVVVGSLPFLGLIVPNIVSMFRGDDLRSNLPWVCLLGIGTVTVCDLIGRTVISPFEMPVSVILGIVGAAVFVYLIVRSTRGR
ncbi:ABC transporter permease [Corynebacterium sp.]|uniref:ABC transporter permease n=1 Tax=Corynebacterium sp. TaxID=1720 RepID=UPI0026DC8DF4|nr:iron chelate uptake ABC transporter family permease subunit [Corynebacterium sp.]MDO5032046.1 iron chelate uptake ABC transporter family permease subunit [Corynebacterium sp.]